MIKSFEECKKEFIEKNTKELNEALGQLKKSKETIDKNFRTHYWMEKYIELCYQAQDIFLKRLRNQGFELSFPNKHYLKARKNFENFETIEWTLDFKN